MMETMKPTKLKIEEKDMNNSVFTVNGEVGADSLGYILPHEQMVYFPIDHDKAGYREIYEHYMPIYKELVEKYNCRTIVEVSPKLISDAFGKCRLPGTENRTNFDLLQEVSRDSRINIVLCTGYYTESCRPDDFKYRTVCDIANEMVDELTIGINKSDIRAGIIKIAIERLDSESDRKLLSAAAIAQKETGSSITTHTCDPVVRLGVLNFLEGAGVNPERIYLGHADGAAEINESISLARRGCSLLYTMWGITNLSIINPELERPLLKYFSSYLVKALIDEGYADRVLLSVDSTSTYFERKLAFDIPGRTSLYNFTFAVPSLKRLGIGQADIDRIMMENPKKMLLQGT
jgi:phosphotriesterase-related protein